MKEYKDHLNPATTFNLISSHGRVDELLFYANLIEDYERVITHHIQRGEHTEALDVLRKAPLEKVESLYYKFGPALILSQPKKAIDTWKDAPKLDPCKLIPALVRYSQHREQQGKATGGVSRGENYAMLFLEHCVRNGNKNPAIHNYLVALYAAHHDPEPLQRFLESHKAGRYICDLRYALRVCTSCGKTAAQVNIYSAMGLYEEAVNLALQVDVEEAKRNANKPSDEELRKKLWLLIARHTIHERDDIKEAIGILKECDLLKIEDILPFFPDFVKIDDFKSEICQSLEDYNGKIERLKAEMKEFTQVSTLGWFQVYRYPGS